MVGKYLDIPAPQGLKQYGGIGIGPGSRQGRSVLCKEPTMLPDSAQRRRYALRLLCEREGSRIENQFYVADHIDPAGL